MKDVESAERLAQSTTRQPVTDGTGKRGYRVLELYYDTYSDKKRDQLYREILEGLGR
ncbi:MAG TPA: hypothetical protein VE955_05900 [Candidatus Dormibacteraeota bacterium]|nr:hypothetical protein [Candidatus Dormibacteraeota bacterium]